MDGACLMLKRSLGVFSLALGVTGLLLMPKIAYGQTALTWARIETLSNRVQLIPSGRNPRVARIDDTMGVGDALRTARSSRAELRFNDGSLARIGQRATFQFTPNTRNFQLSNGTVLLLIPPGRGRTTIQTPNAVTGIQGSALFVRNIPETNTTIVGALTDNPAGPMMAYNEDGSQQQPLYAGQMVVIENDQISQLFEFDLMTFYQTSGLVEGLNLAQPDESLGSDELDEVRQEILDAIEGQEPVEGPDTSENPAFTRPPTVSSALSEQVAAVTTAFPEYSGSPAETYLLGTGDEPVSNISVAATSTPDPTASLSDTETLRQSNSPEQGAQPSGGAIQNPIQSAPNPTATPTPNPTVVTPTPSPAPTAVTPTPSPSPAPTAVTPTPSPAPTPTVVDPTPSVRPDVDAPGFVWPSSAVPDTPESTLPISATTVPDNLDLGTIPEANPEVEVINSSVMNEAVGESVPQTPSQIGANETTSNPQGPENSPAP